MPRGRVVWALFSALAAFGLCGCGLIYISPSVSEGGSFGKKTDLKVDIVPLTYETMIAANMAPHVPSRLPLGFQPDAIQRVAASSIAIPDLAPIPSPPSRPGERPGIIQNRLPPSEPPKPYTIGVADVLELAVDTSNLTLDQLPGLLAAQTKRQGFVVQDDGAIAIPDAGRVRVAGMTLQDAEAAIFQALVSAGIDPSFSLEIAEFNSQRVAVGGEVREPSLVPITLRPLYLDEAISAAGGLAVPDERVARILLIRGDETYQISLERYINDPAVRQIVLRDGDSVFVDSEFQEERARNLFNELLQVRGAQQDQVLFRLQAANARAQQEANAIARNTAERQLFKDRLELGAVARDYAYVTGEVVVPKRIPLPFENSATLADVLFNDGGRGININYGDYSEIYVLRRPVNPAEAGSVTAYHLNANNAANLALASRFEMHGGDVVFVAEQPVTAWNRTLNQIVPSLFTSIARSAADF